ncbi:hypothetical protein C8R44DRAFT_848546 [Mycena epipterygia]|nr:hypothetical protein C8R44DRAFT_848546 [Mycena epipterygia]
MGITGEIGEPAISPESRGPHLQLKMKTSDKYLFRIMQINSLAEFRAGLDGNEVGLHARPPTAAAQRHWEVCRRMKDAYVRACGSPWVQTCVERGASWYDWTALAGIGAVGGPGSRGDPHHIRLREEVSRSACVASRVRLEWKEAGAYNGMWRRGEGRAAGITGGQMGPAVRKVGGEKDGANGARGEAGKRRQTIYGGDRTGA